MKVFFLIVSLCMHVWSFGYEDAVQKAIKENKKLLVELVMESCPYCERFQKYVLSKDDVKVILDKDFVFVVLDIDKDTIPEQFSSRMTPTFYFLSSDGQKILHEMKGAPAKSDFINTLNYIISAEQK